MIKCSENGIIILNYNTFDDTVRCVDSVLIFVQEPRIYIVDNGSPDGSGQELSARYQQEKNIRVILSKENGGFSYGNNLGMTAAIEDGCKYLFLLNSDVYLLNDAVSIMAEMLKNSQEIAAVGPQVLNRNGEDIQFARKALTFCRHLAERLPLLNDKKVRCYCYDRKKDFVFDGMVSGCCFGVNANDIQKLDDRVFLYYEEDILAHQLRKMEKKACICHEAKVVHNEAVSTKKSIKTGKTSFERMYRWSSAFYVLKTYAGMNSLQEHFLRVCNQLEWGILALSKKEYKERSEIFNKLMK